MIAVARLCRAVRRDTVSVGNVGPAFGFAGLFGSSAPFTDVSRPC